MLPSRILGAAKSSSVESPAFDFARNPYKAKRVWPPDFSKLSERHQFSFERRYKRRAKLKWARPRFMIATKLAQWGACTAAVVYCVLFMDWGNDQAFKGVRDWYKETTSSLFTPRTAPPQISQENTRSTS